MALGFLAGYGLFSDNYLNDSMAFGAAFSYSFSKNIAIEFAGLFLSPSNDHDPAKLSQGKLLTIPLQLSLLGRFPVGTKLTPYALAGITYFLNSFSMDRTAQDNWNALGFTMTEKVDAAIGFHLGAGLEYALGEKLSAGAGVRYCMGKADGEWSIKDNQSSAEANGTFSGLDLNSLVLSIGLKYFLK